jgi:hypothetical protein
MDTGDCREWAREQFGALELGDGRRTVRVVEMACAAARRPGGRVLDVFQSSASRQGAYGLLENSAVRSEVMVDGIGLATASNCQGHSYVLVSVDGSSLSIVSAVRVRSRALTSLLGREQPKCSASPDVREQPHRRRTIS